MIFQHSRFQVWNKNQHPFSHSLSEFSYFNPALPPGTVYNLEQAMNWLFAVIYPQTKPAVNTVGDLPAVGNTLNDYRVVLDDGDGKAASYRWEQREGEVSPSWHKIYDMDWGEQSILSNFLLQTQEVYVYKHGKDDLDGNGNVIVGTFAGQSVFGGASPNTNLTLRANSGDGVGPRTGFVQVTDDFRPTTDNDLILGTPLFQWKELWVGTEANIANITISAGVITSASGAISFDDEDLSTTGNGTFGSLDSTSYIAATGDVSGAGGLFDYVNAMVSPSAFFSGTTIGNITVANGSITSASGAISFGDENLSTTGTLTVGTMLIQGGSITDTTNIIDFGNTTNLVNMLNITALGDISSGGVISGPAVEINSNTVKSIGGNNLLLEGASGWVKTIGNLEVNAGGSGEVRTNRVQGWSTGAVSALQLFASGGIFVNDYIAPISDATNDFGYAGGRFRTLFLSDAIHDGTNQIAMGTLVSLRDINVGVASGMTIFWDGTKWVASYPDTEVDHGTITGLGDDDHTQYLLLAGRNGGQSVFGGINAAENLTLSSTSHPTKGDIVFNSDMRPFTDAIFDIGAASFRINDLHMSGEIVGLTPETSVFASPPASPIAGQMFYATDNFSYYGWRNSAWKRLNIEKYVFTDTTGWDGVATSVVYNPTDIADCRVAVWMLLDNADNYKQIMCEVSKTATQVTVSAAAPLPAGTYTLVGIS